MRTVRSTRVAATFRTASPPQIVLTAAAIGVAAGLLALFSGASNVIPIGRETVDQGGKLTSLLVLNPPLGGQQITECTDGTIKLTVPLFAPIRPEPTDSALQIGLFERGQLVCTLEKNPAGWWKVALPADGRLQGWVEPQAFRTVQLAVADGRGEASEVAQGEDGIASAVSTQLATVDAQLKSTDTQLKAIQDAAKSGQDGLLAQLGELQAQARAVQSQLLAKLSEAKAQAEATQGELQTAQEQLAASAKEVQTVSKRVSSLESARTVMTVLAVVLPLLVGAAAVGGFVLIWRRLLPVSPTPSKSAPPGSAPLRPRTS